MAGSEIWAVVVTFHPDEEVLRNLEALQTEVPHIVVVDNGSLPGELVELRAAACNSRFQFIENGDNLGIATALNLGIRQALAGGANWVLLFDQDSRVTPGFAGEMVRGFEQSRWADRLGLLAPVYRDKRFGSEIVPESLPGGGLEVAMTSGSLLRSRTLHEHGLFVDELFIDGVDHEYSLRLRKAGLVVDTCAEAVLLHSPGTPTNYNLLGWRFQAANYSPLRRYYQERNKIWIYRRYFRDFPRYCRRLLRASAADFVKIILVERGKAEKLRFFLRGVWHGLRQRMGRASNRA